MYYPDHYLHIHEYIRIALLQGLKSGSAFPSCWDHAMVIRSINKDKILQSTLFHIQLKQCQYIDNFPEAVANVFEKSVERGRLREYEKLKRRLYRISTSFFELNRKRIKKRDFFESLYQRIARVMT
jgi:hypothetical protein